MKVTNMPAWRCKKCGTEFTPSSGYGCPKCGSNATVPKDRPMPKVNPSIVEIPERMCPKCEAVMRLGFTVQKDAWDQILMVGGGVYWAPKESVVVGPWVALSAYLCPECGFVEQYARRLKQDRELILSAPTQKTERV